MRKTGKNLCLQCPDDIKGICCCFPFPMGEFVVALTNQYCEHYNPETKRCKKYANRKKAFKHCTGIKEGIKNSGLPLGCLYLKGKEHLIKKPKMKFEDIVDKLKNPAGAINIYNAINNHPRKLSEVYGK